MQNEFNKWLKSAMELSKKTNAIASLEDFDKMSETARNLILKMYEENPSATKDEIYYKMKTSMQTLITSMIDFSDFKSDVIRRNAIKKLLNDRTLMEKTYNEIISEEIRSGKKIKITNVIDYSSNPQKAIKQAVLEAIISVRKFILETTQEEAKAIKLNTGNKENYRKLLMRIGTEKRTREELNNLKGLFCARNEFEQIRFFLEKMSSKELLDKEIKEEYINSIIIVGENLNKFGVLEKYIKQQNSEIKKLKLDKIMPIKEDGAFETLFNRETLQKLSIYTLSALYAFWTNRLVKETINIYKSYFIMYELNLDSKNIVQKGKLSQRISQEKFDALKLKFNAIHIKTADVYTECRKISKEKTSVNISDTVKKLESEFGKQYNKYFSGIGGLQGLENNFAKDFTLYMGLENLEKNIYGQKDSSILALLGLLYNNENMSANWGIIQESKKSDYVLIGIDLPDLNMPLRLHIKKDLVEKFTQAHQGNKIMPIYAGKDDFIVNGRYLATHVLTPLSKDQKREIEEISTQIRETDYRHKLVKHLVFLTDMQKFPEHLQKKIIIYKKGKTKVKFEKMLEYIDIETNRKYIKTKEGQFILQDDER